VIYGNFLLHSAQIGVIGTVKTGDSLGEEGIFENPKSPILRKETVTSEEESFVLEVTRASWSKLSDKLKE
jgi:CRP-like cAMP-binding protein